MAILLTTSDLLGPRSPFSFLRVAAHLGVDLTAKTALDQFQQRVLEHPEVLVHFGGDKARVTVALEGPFTQETDLEDSRELRKALTGNATLRGIAEVRDPEKSELSYRTNLFLDGNLPLDESVSPWFQVHGSVPLRTGVSVDQLLRTLEEQGATTPFTNVLIWNSGMSAARFLHGYRVLSQRLTGDPHAICVSTILTDDDRESGFRSKGDRIVPLDGLTAQETYLHLEKFRSTLRSEVESVRRERGDKARLAVAVGWGYLAENDKARRIADEEGVIFIGPGAEAILGGGDKDRAKKIARSQMVPVVPGSEGTLSSVAEAGEVANRIGYPVLLKARAGGGGKGIREVSDPNGLASAYQGAASEALKAFGDAALLVEKMVVRPRHIEIQVARDKYGNTIAVGERECSLQRRFQKVVESGAHHTVPPETLRAMRRDAVAYTEAAGYENVGTVEFLYDEETKQYYFMEMNTRLQVEHPVTEGQTGIDLVALQAAIAMGVSLESLFTPAQRYRFMEGVPDQFTLAVRIVAEDGWEGQGSTGVIETMHLPQDIPGLRHYFSMGVGARVTGRSDSQIGHLFVTAGTYQEALAGMIQALDQLEIKGITTNTTFLRALLRSDEVQTNQGIHTKFVQEEFIPAHQGEAGRRANVDIAIIAAVLRGYDQKMETLGKRVSTACSQGRTEGGTRYQSVEVLFDGHNYPFRVVGDGRGNYRMEWGKDLSLDVEIIDLPDGERRLKIERAAYIVDYRGEGISIDHGEPFSFLPRDPDTAYSKFSGRVIAMDAVVGNEVKAEVKGPDGKTVVRKADRLCVVEAMKMENPVPAPSDGVVGEILVGLGVMVEEGQPLVKIFPKKPRPPTVRVELPRGVATDLGFERLASNLLCGVEVLPTLVIESWRAYSRGGLVYTAEEAHPVRMALALLEKFWNREQRYALSQVQEGKTAEGHLDFVLSRGTLKAQISLMREILITLQGLRTEGLEQPLRDRLLKLVDSMMVATPSRHGYQRLHLEARRLSDHLRPPSPIDVQATLIAVARGEGDETGVLSGLARHPNSLVLQTAGLLVRPEQEVRRVAGLLLLQRTYLSYQLKEADFKPASSSGEGHPEMFVFGFFDARPGPREERFGTAFYLPPSTELAPALRVADRLLQERREGTPTDQDVIEVALSLPEGETVDSFAERIGASLVEVLPTWGGRRITFMVVDAGERKTIFVDFRPNPSGGWMQPTVQPYHPIDAGAMELWRFQDFDYERLPSTNRSIHVFEATARGVKGDVRISVRTTLPASEVGREGGANGLRLPEIEKAFQGALDNLTRAILEKGADIFKGMNTIFINVETPLPLAYEDIEGAVLALAERHQSEYVVGRLRSVEVALRLEDPEDQSGRGYKEVLVRVTKPYGTKFKVRTFVVVVRSDGEGDVLVPLDEFLKARDNEGYRIPNKQIRNRRPYVPVTPLGLKETTEHDRGCLYVYERPRAIRDLLEGLWKGHDGQGMPEDAFRAQELVLVDPDDETRGLEPITRAGGKNNLAVVVWEVSLRFPGEKTPRRFVLASGDQTVVSGSSDLPDDRLDAAASYHAVREGIPLVSLLAGSGARMIPNEEVFRAAIEDPETGGFLLSGKNYERLRDQVEAVPVGDGSVYLVTGVYAVNQSSLKGSGLMIAGAIDASEEVPTLGLAVGSVVVGKHSYKWRECRSTGQKEGTVVLLTGHRAINAGKGGVYYRGDDDVGPADVHAASGVGHNIFPDEMAAYRYLLEWLRFTDAKIAPRPLVFKPRPDYSGVDWTVPLPEGVEDRDAEQLLLSGKDPVIKVDGGNASYDPRALVRALADGEFTEVNRVYAPNVVTGYASFGGVLVGVVAFETQTQKTILPIDLAEPKEEAARTRHWPPRVWGPEGARKTAEFIQEADWHGKSLLVIPNIRGFLGDPTAFLGEVLKAGGDIARYLRRFRGRIVTWQPPYSDLRGGAEVVIDPEINRNIIAFMDPSATLGVVEPEMQLTLPKAQRMVKMLTDKGMPMAQAEERVRRFLRLQDVATVAVRQGRLTAVLPTQFARRGIVRAFQMPVG